jgi:hypothetical protein
MTAFAKAYTLLREEEQRKKADILCKANNFALHNEISPRKKPLLEIFSQLFSQIADPIARFLPSNCLDPSEREFLMAVKLRTGVVGGAR